MALFNFPPTSRCFGIEVKSLERDDGEVVAYLARRFVPPSSRFAVLRWHRVSEGERVDHIAAREQIDAEAFWRIGDANDAMRPEDLTVPVGRLLRIPLPEGFPGPPSP